MPDNPVLGRLPKWPRKALNNSVIAAEQAYRKRSGLPLLSDADMEALRAGVQMTWGSSDGAQLAAPGASPAPSAPAGTPSAHAAAPPATAPATTGGGEISPEVAAIVAKGKKWSKSSVAAENARRKRNNLPALTDAEITALLGEP